MMVTKKLVHSTQMSKSNILMVTFATRIKIIKLVRELMSKVILEMLEPKVSLRPYFQNDILYKDKSLLIPLLDESVNMNANKILF